MWVSRKEWEDLKDRVRKLEYAPVISQWITVRRWPELGYNSPCLDLDYGDAIKAIAAYVGCEFKYQEGTPTTAVLVKKAK